MRLFNPERLTELGSSFKVEFKDTWTVGTDCAGLGTDHIASKMINLSSRCAFASERDPKVRLLLRQTLADDFMDCDEKLRPVIYKDMTKRNLQKVPDIDIYIAGPACQPWSLQGCEIKNLRNFWSNPCAIDAKIFIYMSYCVHM